MLLEKKLCHHCVSWWRCGAVPITFLNNPFKCNHNHRIWNNIDCLGKFERVLYSSVFCLFSSITAPQVERKWWLECRWLLHPKCKLSGEVAGHFLLPITDGDNCSRMINEASQLALPLGRRSMRFCCLYCSVVTVTVVSSAPKSSWFVRYAMNNHTYNHTMSPIH